MPKKQFIPKLGLAKESMCSLCCQTIRPTQEAPTLKEAEAAHHCEAMNLNTFHR